MAKEFKFGRMDQYMRDIGKMIKLLEKEDLFMLMGMCMKVIGLIINLTDMVFTFTKMVHDMKDFGKNFIIFLKFYFSYFFLNYKFRKEDH